MIGAQIDAGYESGSGFRSAINQFFGTSPAAMKGKGFLKGDWIDTPIGPMLVVADDHALHLLEFADRPALPAELKRLKARTGADMVLGRTPVTGQIAAELAAYFAGLELPYPPVRATTDASPEMLARGKALVFQGDAARGIPACAQCHGQALTGVQPGIPGLVGLPRLYLSSQLGAWLTNDRHARAPDCMAEVGKKLTTADINAVTSWLALQPVPADTRPLAALPGPLPTPCSAMNR